MGVGVDGNQLHLRPGAVDHHHQQQLGRQPHQDGHQLWAHRLPHGHRLLAHPHCLAATSRRKRTDSKAIELKNVQPTTAISHCSTRNNKNISHKKKLHNISVVFNQKRMCSICSTKVTKNLRSTHTKKLKAKYFTTEPTLKIGCEKLRSPTKGSAQAFKDKFMQ